MPSVKVIDQRRCNAEVGAVLEVSEVRADRWCAKGWAELAKPTKKKTSARKRTSEPKE